MVKECPTVAKKKKRATVKIRRNLKWSYSCHKCTITDFDILKTVLKPFGNNKWAMKSFIKYHKIDRKAIEIPCQPCYYQV